VNDISEWAQSFYADRCQQVVAKFVAALEMIPEELTTENVEKYVEVNGGISLLSYYMVMDRAIGNMLDIFALSPLTDDVFNSLEKLNVIRNREGIPSLKSIAGGNFETEITPILIYLYLVCSRRVPIDRLMQNSKIFHEKYKDLYKLAR
jgi:hypothetical protein